MVLSSRLRDRLGAIIDLRDPWELDAEDLGWILQLEADVALTRDYISAMDVRTIAVRIQWYGSATLQLQDAS
ncbi:hypothetical protein [Thioalkalivibrio sp.]|uniref:hypothetical protein n=1 Tax=Thioalkalivibrio sp. TaxID=2093813 RepID=UPI003563C79E